MTGVHRYVVETCPVGAAPPQVWLTLVRGSAEEVLPKLIEAINAGLTDNKWVLLVDLGEENAEEAS
jgi:hypothetical protein